MLPKRCIQPPCMNMAVKMFVDVGRGLGTEARRNERPVLNEGVAALQFQQEDEDVDDDQYDRHDREGLRSVLSSPIGNM